MLCELSNEELAQIAAAEVMGWRLHESGVWMQNNPGPDGRAYWEGIGCIWRPAVDRNQSRLVVEAAIEKTSAVDVGSNLWDRLKYHDILTTTPRQEVEAAILAIRALQTPGDKP